MRKKDGLNKRPPFLQKIRQRFEDAFGRAFSVQTTILFSYTIVSLFSTLFLGLTLYQQFVRETKVQMTKNAQQSAKQTVSSLEDYLRNMREISDAMYYDVIKNVDFSVETVDREMNLLYEANKNDLISFALYSTTGRLLSAAPSSIEKKNVNVWNQEWFRYAQEQVENMHFSLPHVQNLFDDARHPYPWVISLSRSVELNDQGKPRQGILLLDMNYSAIQEMLAEINESNASQYVYLTGSNGKLIYHPKKMQIQTGFDKENNLDEARLSDGIHEVNFENTKRIVVVQTISYTGWKLVTVLPASSFRIGLSNSRYALMLMITVTMLAVLIVNRFVAAAISKPIKDLDRSIREIEKGKAKQVYIGGSSEVTHLAQTLQNYLEQNDLLMDEILIEQEEKRKSELDALQSQINPHFLYNTLDSIVWMIEEGGTDEAVFMITELASLFRISLSKGHTIIPIQHEIKHAKNYMNIQKARYKDHFEIVFDIDEKINQYCTVKLLIQPILENAIYYGISKEDEDGKILVKGELKDDEIFISVIDNGFGMDQETVDGLLLENQEKAPSKGSGVGLLNVHKRIQLRFGEKYGLMIHSQMDEGTCVTIHLPAIVYNEENRLMLEEVHYPKRNKEESSL